jgi:rhamnogalacturonyl hydrolase YesR
VTLYGLLETGRALDRPDLVAHVREHFRACTALYPYMAWDERQFGLPAINGELAALSMLDHCGSAGATLLEATADESLPGADALTADIADYMADEQERLPDGAFYRTPTAIPNMNETLWADDLYMATPFLARYYEHTGDRSYLDDAIQQFRLFENYLGQEDPAVLSHVYDARHEVATGVPWGRGNGWALFSLVEVLDRTPADHPEREALQDRFERWAAAYRSVQDETGFWHQVLTDPEAYVETSCTAMFTWAFARGVRRGWLPESYADAAIDGWNAIARGAVDSAGNVHGVCHGSSYSFSPDYYTDELGTVTNDLHGIGIVLLAGVETARLRPELADAV